MLDLYCVTKSFASHTVIATATLRVAAGEILWLTGPSGVGKSTLLELMAGVTLPDTGSITRQPAALMFQDDVLIPWLRARDAVSYILPRNTPDPTGHAARWLARFGLTGDEFPAAMSGGMRRRLSLARTFAAERPLLLLDEPFAFLDAANCRIVAEEVAAHAARGHAIVAATHTTAPLDTLPLAGLPCRLLAIQSSPVCIEQDTFPPGRM